MCTKMAEDLTDHNYNQTYKIYLMKINKTHGPDCGSAKQNGINIEEVCFNYFTSNW